MDSHSYIQGSSPKLCRFRSRSTGLNQQVQTGEDSPSGIRCSSQLFTGKSEQIKTPENKSNDAESLIFTKLSSDPESWCGRRDPNCRFSSGFPLRKRTLQDCVKAPPAPPPPVCLSSLFPPMQQTVQSKVKV